MRAIHAVRLRADNIRPYGDSAVNTNLYEKTQKERTALRPPNKSNIQQLNGNVNGEAGFSVK